MFIYILINNRINGRIRGYFWTTEGYKMRRCMYGSFPCTSSIDLFVSHTYPATRSLILQNGVESRRSHEGEAAAAATTAAISPATASKAYAVQQRKS
jgi:hypothetical protein